MDGTYIREPDGANLLRYSPHRYRDAASALRSRVSGDDFTIVYPDTPAWDMDVENEAQYLVPGEWLIIDGPLMEIGGAL